MADGGLESSTDFQELKDEVEAQGEKIEETNDILTKELTKQGKYIDELQRSNHELKEATKIQTSHIKTLEEKNVNLSTELKNQDSQIKEWMEVLTEQTSRMKSFMELQQMKMALDDIYTNGNSRMIDSFRGSLKGKIQDFHEQFRTWNIGLEGMTRLDDVHTLRKKIISINRHNFGFYIGKCMKTGNEALRYLKDRGPKGTFWTEYMLADEMTKLHTYFVFGASGQEKELTEEFMIEERCLNTYLGTDRDIGGILYVIHYDMTPGIEYKCLKCPKACGSRIGALHDCFKIRIKERKDVLNRAETVAADVPRQ